MTVLGKKITNPELLKGGFGWVWERKHREHVLLILCFAHRWSSEKKPSLQLSLNPQSTLCPLALRSLHWKCLKTVEYKVKIAVLLANWTFFLISS